MNYRTLAKSLLPPILLDIVRGKQTNNFVPYSNHEFKIKLRKTFFEGSTFFLPGYALHRPACRDLLAGRFYEPKTHRLIPAILRELGGNMVHAGTFFGDMLPSFARTNARIYAFEPVLENYVLARLCVIENELENVVLFHAALGEGQGTVRMDTGEEIHSGGASSVSDSGQITTIVSIDSISPENVSVIQLDVEGYELHALKGASATIERDSPVILIEDNKGNCAPFLTGKGYAQTGQIPGLSIWTRGEAPLAVKEFD